MKMFFVILLTLIIFLLALANIYIYYYIDKPTGPQGEKGEKGEKGDVGDAGDIGYRGPPGYKGEKGIIGKNIGLIGIPGNQGPRGVIGNEGEKGFKGLKGDKGIKGPKGINGFAGFEGKRGLQGPKGYSREISDLKPLKLSADKTKCIQIYANGNEMKCPENMAVFNIKAKKESFKTEGSVVEKIICCKFQISNQFSDDYFNKVSLISNLSREVGLMSSELDNLNNSSSPGKYYNLIKNYNEEQIITLTNKVNLILTLINNITKKTYREMPLNKLEILLGDIDLAKRIKIYNEDEINNIIENHESITSYEFYILNLINGLITLRQRKGENTIDTTDYNRLLKEVYDFPKNDISQLEKKVNI